MRSLLWLANQNSITIHVWPSRTPNFYKPAICVFDLDPFGDAADKRQLDVLCRGALDLRALLKELGLPSWIKTTGSKGFHIAVPLDAKADFATVAHFAHRVGKLLVARDPENLTREFRKVDRPRSHSRRHRSQRLQRHVRRCLHCSCPIRSRPEETGLLSLSNQGVHDAFQAAFVKTHQLFMKLRKIGVIINWESDEFNVFFTPV